MLPCLIRFSIHAYIVSKCARCVAHSTELDPSRANTTWSRRRATWHIRPHSAFNSCRATSASCAAATWRINTRQQTGRSSQSVDVAEHHVTAHLSLIFWIVLEWQQQIIHYKVSLSIFHSAFFFPPFPFLPQPFSSLAYLYHTILTVPVHACAHG